MRCGLKEEIVKIFTDRNSLVVDDNFECRVFGSPDVGQCDIGRCGSSIAEAMDAEGAGDEAAILAWIKGQKADTALWQLTIYRRHDGLPAKQGELFVSGLKDRSSNASCEGQCTYKNLIRADFSWSVRLNYP
jgi:hypothetical protein